jgi:calcineurin-like phosphoesterase family protein
MRLNVDLTQPNDKKNVFFTSDFHLFHNNVHGHCHGNLHHGEDANYYWNRRAIDAGCMFHDYKPISHTQVIEKLSHVVLPTLTRITQ